MANIGFCSIGPTKLSSKSRRGIEEIRSIIEQGNLFATALASIPIYQIFMTPSVTKSAFETGVTIREYDWELFADALGTAPKLVRSQIYRVAEPLTWYTSGKEQEFWRCVSDSAL